MDYFGTSLDEHGHYRFELEENSMIKLHYDFDKHPFHPENLTDNLPKGEVIFYQSNKYTVLGISGSCKDTRPGTKSIFWLKEIITLTEMKERILNIPIAKRIIEKMPFVVRWQNNTQSSSNCNIPHVMLRLNKEEKELMIDGLNSAIAICDWDNYNKEEYEGPKAQISWYYSLIAKLNEA